MGEFRWRFGLRVVRPAMATVSIELAEYMAGVTDAGGSGKQVIRLALVRTQLRLLEGSLAVAYVVGLIDKCYRKTQLPCRIKDLTI